MADQTWELIAEERGSESMGDTITAPHFRVG
jgi:hypothetical protein